MSERDSALSPSPFELSDVAAAASEPSPLSLAPSLAPLRGRKKPLVALPSVARLASANTQSPWAARAKVAEYANLRPDWDGRGGHRPSDEDIANALAVIDEIADAAVQEPRPCAVGDGEIVLSWRLPNDGYLDICFEEGQVIYIACSSDGGESEGECDFSDKSRRDSIVAEIRQFMHAHIAETR